MKARISLGRCHRCRKIAFETEALAEKRLREIRERVSLGIQPVRSYFDERCGWWHLTSQEKREVISLRDYQEYSVEALFDYFANNTGNPIIALPTGTGKSIVIDESIRRACQKYAGTRILMLTHVKELIEQNLKSLLKIWPTAPAGVYSAGLRRKEHQYPITFAGIQSVHNKAELFGEIHLVMIDECHLVGTKESTSYRKFIDALRQVNPLLKVIGFSATPWRLKQGMLTDPGGLFTDIAVDMTSRDAFNWLIRQGWLAPLVPKKTETQIDVSRVRMQGGEFVLNELQEAVDRDEVTNAALREAVETAKDRHHWLCFASGVEHAEHVANRLEEFGVSATYVHSKMPDEERDRRIKAFKSGKIRALVNNNILTTGFDYPEIDCIVMLRPTASPGLWVQMLGRGTRPVYTEGYDLNLVEERLQAIAASAKPNCLVLDFAGNTARLGPINDPVIPKQKGRGAPGIAPVRLCEVCSCYSHAASRFCENCGAEFLRAVKISSTASIQEVIAGLEPSAKMPGFTPVPIEKFPVGKVVYRVHNKPGKPDSMRVDYYCGIQRFSEYVCLDHGGGPARVARAWWRTRLPQEWIAQYGDAAIPPNVEAGMQAIDHLRVPKNVEVAMKKDYPQIMGYEFE